MSLQKCPAVDAQETVYAWGKQKVVLSQDIPSVQHLCKSEMVSFYLISLNGLLFHESIKSFLEQVYNVVVHSIL